MPFGGFSTNADAAPAERVILVTGIAQAGPLVAYLKKSYTLVEHVAFADHHRYTRADLEGLTARVAANPGISIVTTEKDSVKLMDEELKDLAGRLPLFYLPMEAEFIKNGKDFDAVVLNAIESAR